MRKHIMLRPFRAAVEAHNEAEACCPSRLARSPSRCSCPVLWFSAEQWNRTDRVNTDTSIATPLCSFFSCCGWDVSRARFDPLWRGPVDLRHHPPQPLALHMQLFFSSSLPIVSPLTAAQAFSKDSLQDHPSYRACVVWWSRNNEVTKLEPNGKTIVVLVGGFTVVWTVEH